MRVKAIAAGAADALRNALRGLDWTHYGVALQGAAVVGAGEIDAPVLARAPAWEALEFAGVDAKALVLVDPPSIAVTRAMIVRAAEARMRTMIVDKGKLRRLSLDDVVGAPLGEIDWARIRARIGGKRVLVTGGGGSIGGELARRLAGLDLARLTLLDSSECNLFKIGLELREAALALADVRDGEAMRRWMRRERPDIVFHTAALKQVPLVELFPSEGVLTNIAGARNVIEAAHAVGADVIFVSTDKAVEPSGMMGATKRLGELYCQALDRQGPRRAVPVRLGNVLGSAGSVAPIFEAQFAAGGPLTVTDPNVTRYFLSIRQAADVLLQAAAIALGAETPRGAAFVIDMGDALPVVELARDVIRLNGLRPDEDVKITFCGMRPGEKMHEQLVGESETVGACGVEGVIVALSQPMPLAEVASLMDRLAALAREGEDARVQSTLFDALGIAMPEVGLAQRA